LEGNHEKVCRSDVGTRDGPRADRLRQYIPKNISPSQTEDYVMKALEHYSRYLEQVKKRNEAR
jgi:hypothetical protein